MGTSTKNTEYFEKFLKIFYKFPSRTHIYICARNFYLKSQKSRLNFYTRRRKEVRIKRSRLVLSSELYLRLSEAGGEFSFEDGFGHKLVLEQELFLSLQKRENDTYTTENPLRITSSANSTRIEAIRARRKEAQKREVKEAVVKSNSYEEDARSIANIYARNILQLRGLEIKRGTVKYDLFIKAAKKLEDFCKSSELDKEFVIKYLIRILQKEYSEHGKAVHIGHLSSDYTWEILLPQMMVEVVPGYTIDPELRKKRVKIQED
jgi:hypothetical protein